MGLMKVVWLGSLAVACGLAGCVGADGADGLDGLDGVDGVDGLDGDDGDPGSTVLIRLDDEEPGEHCANGGVAVHSGADADGDGVLDDAEIAATEYVCDGDDGAPPDDVYYGGVVIDDAADVAALAGYTTIVGSVVITGAVTTVTLPELVHVVGDFRTSFATGLAEVHAPALLDVGGDLTISAGPLTEVDLPQARTFGVTTVFGTELTDVAVGGPAALSSLQVGGASVSGAGLSIGASTMLQHVSLGIAHAGSVTVDDTQLVTLAFPALIAAAVVVTDNIALTSVALPALVDTGWLQIDGSPNVAELTLGSLTSVDRMYVRGTDITELVGLEAVTSALEIRVSGNDSLVDLGGLSGLTDVGLLEIGGAAVTGASLAAFADLTSVGSLMVVGTAAASLDGFAGLTTITYDLNVSSNASLTSLAGLSALTSIGRAIVIAGDTALTDLGLLGTMDVVHGNLTLNGLSSLPDLAGLAGLTAVEGTLELAGLAVTSLAGLSDLDTVGGLVLSALAVPDLQGLEGITTTGAVAITQSEALIDLAGLDNLTTIGDLTLSVLPNLTDLSGLGDLVTVAGFELTSTGVTDLDDLVALRSLGYTSISFNPQLVRIDALLAITAYTGIPYLYIAFNTVLPSCEATDVHARIQTVFGGSVTASIYLNDGVGTCP